MFDRSKLGYNAGREILRLRQGGGSVSDYAIEFQTLATDRGWEGRALFHSFIHGLFERVKDELLTWELPEDLARLISPTIWTRLLAGGLTPLLQTPISTQDH